MIEQALKTTAVLFTEQKTPVGTLGIIALNNPRALNAITLEMFQALEGRLPGVVRRGLAGRGCFSKE